MNDLMLGHNNPPIGYKTVKLTDIPATLYQRGDVESGFWYVRFWFSEERRYKTFSTKTNVLVDAKQVALEKFVELKIKKAADIPIFTKTFAELANEVIKTRQKMAERQEISPKTACNWNSKLTRYYIPFFGNKQISSITQKDVDDFWDWRIDYWMNVKNDGYLKNHPNLKKRPTSQTLHNEAPVFRAVFINAVKHGFISSDKIPNLTPPIKKTKNRRAALSRKEYERLLRYMSNGWLTKDPRRHIRFSRKRLQTLIIVTANSGMRPPEFYNLTWRDIELRKDDGYEWTELHVHGKGKRHVIQCAKFVHKRLADWRKFLADEYKRKASDDDLVFGELDGARTQTFNESFKRLLTVVGIPLIYQTERRTLYSLRHLYATTKLRSGVTHVELAENMDTGVDMIKEHYGHVSLPEKAEAIIRGRRRFYPRR